MAVVDANIASSLFVDLPWSGDARAALRDADERIAPAIFAVEIGVVASKNIHAGVLSLQDGVAAIRAILPTLQLVPDSELLEPALDMAVSQKHPLYDCLYLTLALERRNVLLTADMKLAALARRMNARFRLFL